jgi:hypothetical protein
VLGEHGTVSAGNDHIHDVFDSYEAFDELLECGTIFRHEACVLEVFIMYDTREKDCSQLLEVVSDRLSPLLDVIPTQGRTGEDQDEAEK